MADQRIKRDEFPSTKVPFGFIAYLRRLLFANLRMELLVYSRLSQE